MARRTAPAPGQYDLFGEDEAAEQAAAGRKTTEQAARAEWEARFERAEMVIMVGPMTATHGPQIPRTVLGWKCPACGDVTSEFLLGTNHGYHLHSPGRVPYIAGSSGEGFGETCTKLWLQANHRIYDERRAMLRHLAGQGMDDEQIAARVGAWSAQTVAGYRQEDAKAARRTERAAKGEIVKVEHGSECPCAYCDGPCSCPSCESFRRSQ